MARTTTNIIYSNKIQSYTYILELSSNLKIISSIRLTLQMEELWETQYFEANKLTFYKNLNLKNKIEQNHAKPRLS